ncbi:MAG: uroporphyrinogen-III C-methyltransferase [Clostridiales bacterium]|nr:uroporphyrinogen-III C-methyltransferase [Clostridiales bacterium]
MSASVYLVGAGSGDELLLTIKGEKILSQAEVVIYDRLVGEDIIEMIPPNAESINVGKQAGHHPVPQGRINEIILEKALEGKKVVRLKGGDSFLFGRGGEELELLREHNIPFQVVPGLPSPVAAAAYAGIPLTHRDFCSSVHFITGHRKENGALEIDYKSLVALNGTLVFLMSLSTCGEIMKGLIEAGLPEETDCAVIENGTRPEQRKFIGTVSNIEKTIEQEGVISPALIIVGRVCSLSKDFDWFSALPLHGKKILTTSPSGTRGRLDARLKELGAKVKNLPAIKRQALGFELPSLEGVKAAVFTSRAGVEIFFSVLFAKGLDARYFGKVKLAAVGTETAAVMKSYGILPDLVPETYNGKALAEAMLETELAKKGDKVLLLRAKKASVELPQVLKAAGVEVSDIAIYETLSLPMGETNPTDYDWLTFTSASCVESFALACSLDGFKDFAAIRALCIGEQTAKAAKALGMEVHIAEKATLESMADYLQEVKL